MVDDLVCFSKCGLQSVLMNAFINAKTNFKKLQFGVSKCHKMHIGKDKVSCPDLKLDYWDVTNTEEIETGQNKVDDEYAGEHTLETIENEKYLGDLISHDGKNTKNIQARRAKGTGIVDQILTRLESTVFGPYFFEVAITLRNSLLINGILTNAEAWYGLKTEEVEQLEKIDEMLLRKILEVGKGCPKEMLYLEMGIFPLRFTVMTRRLLFLHYILTEDKKSLIYRFLQAQVKNPSKNDWYLTIKEDLEFLEIFLDFDDIKSLPEQSFKKFVNEQVEEKAFQYLEQLKAKHSKVDHIKHNGFNMQEYFLPENVYSIQMTKFIFQAKTRMIDVKCNFKNKFKKEDRKCPFGCDLEDSQEHLLLCPNLQEREICEEIIEYDDLFSPIIKKQLTVAMQLEKRLLRRKKKEQEISQ